MAWTAAETDPVVTDQTNARVHEASQLAGGKDWPCNDSSLKTKCFKNTLVTVVIGFGVLARFTVTVFDEVPGQDRASRVITVIRDYVHSKLHQCDATRNKEGASTAQPVRGSNSKLKGGRPDWQRRMRERDVCAC